MKNVKTLLNIGVIALALAAGLPVILDQINKQEIPQNNTQRRTKQIYDISPAKSVTKNLLEKIGENQGVIPIFNHKERGYILLTDFEDGKYLRGDGLWDMMERVRWAILQEIILITYSLKKVIHFHNHRHHI